MNYDLLKTAHLTAMIVWMAGMIHTPVLLARLSQGQDARTALERRLLHALRRQDRLITTPALILTWIFGMTLALKGGWFVAAWIWPKLVLVLVLSALHGFFVGQFRQLEADAAYRPPAWLGYGSLAVIVVLTIIAGLATLKP